MLLNLPIETTDLYAWDYLQMHRILLSFRLDHC